MKIVGVGTDVVECLRVAQLIERHGDVFLRRVFSDHEVEYCSSRQFASQHYSSRWAAKEATLKALGLSMEQGMTWRDIEVRTPINRSPRLAFGGKIADVVSDRRIHAMHVAIAHCRTHATATVIAEASG